MSAFVGAHEQWLTVAWLPAYAPELNPVEGTWPTVEEQRGLPRLLQLTAPADRHREEPGSSAPGTGRPLPTDSSPRPDSASNPNQRRPRPWPFKPCSQAQTLGRGVSTDPAGPDVSAGPETRPERARRTEGAAVAGRKKLSAMLRT